MVRNSRLERYWSGAAHEANGKQRTATTIAQPLDLERMMDLLSALVSSLVDPSEHGYGFIDGQTGWSESNSRFTRDRPGSSRY
jgi:hypothetical protein